MDKHCGLAKPNSPEHCAGPGLPPDDPSAGPGGHLASTQQGGYVVCVLTGSLWWHFHSFKLFQVVPGMGPVGLGPRHCPGLLLHPLLWDAVRWHQGAIGFTASHVPERGAQCPRVRISCTQNYNCKNPKGRRKRFVLFEGPGSKSEMRFFFFKTWSLKGHTGSKAQETELPHL